MLFLFRIKLSKMDSENDSTMQYTMVQAVLMFHKLWWAKSQGSVHATTSETKGELY